jgi:hypothetical protein
MQQVGLDGPEEKVVPALGKSLSLRFSSSGVLILVVLGVRLAVACSEEDVFLPPC